MALCLHVFVVLLFLFNVVNGNFPTELCIRVNKLEYVCIVKYLLFYELFGRHTPSQASLR